jgi:hypothetical protein
VETLLLMAADGSGLLCVLSVCCQNYVRRRWHISAQGSRFRFANLRRRKDLFCSSYRPQNKGHCSLTMSSFRISPGKSNHNGRTAHIEAILGRELCARLPRTKVLLVGAGGIGCELCESNLWTIFPVFFPGCFLSFAL